MNIEKNYSQKNILKINWERGSNFISLSGIIIQDLITPFTNKKLVQSTLCATGCANTNYFLQFEDDSKCILRIYVRDHSAILREQHIHNLISNTIPMPQMLYSDISLKHINHPFALIEYKSGNNMRDIVLSGNQNEISTCAFQAGKLIYALKSIKLPCGGFFQTNGSIKPFSTHETFNHFAFTMLKKTEVIQALGVSLCKTLMHWIENNKACFVNSDPPNLTHSDFDPANMLVTKINKNYQITALLDWEFCHAGSYLMDVGQFLRFSHQLPSCYKEYFIRGLSEQGLKLPDNWERIAKANDLIALLSILYFNTKNNRPKMISNIKSLMEYTIHHYSDK